MALILLLGYGQTYAQATPQTKHISGSTIPAAPAVSFAHERSSKDQKIKRCLNAPLFILDNDHYDPDWVPTLVTALALDAECEGRLIAVAISGRDLNDRAGLMYQSVLRYYGRDLKIGINHQADTREEADKATFVRPKLAHEYLGSKKDISEFDNDGIPDSKREDITKILCETLQQYEGGISYVVGGHLDNLAALLKETHYCNGRELIAEKIKQVIVSTGRTLLDHQPETNLGARMGVRRSARYVVEHLPPNVKLIMGTEGHAKDKTWPRAGNQYKRDRHIDSPMAFVYAVPTYGVFGDHEIGDAEVVLYAVYGTYLDGFHLYDEIETCFRFDANLVAYAVKGCTGKNHYYLRDYNGYTTILGKKVNQLMSRERPEQNASVKAAPSRNAPL